MYFGTNFDNVKYGRVGTFKGNQKARCYDLGTLEPCTTYYWRIKPVIEEEEEDDGPIIVESVITTSKVRIYDSIYIGDVWSFTTGPAKATNPHPANGATDVDPNAILSWTPGCSAAFHDVYFGTDLDAVANADTSDTTGIYRARLDAKDYNPGGLEPGTTYYWKIDEVVLTAGQVWRVSDGDVWSFTTTGDPNECEVCLTRYIVDGPVTDTYVSSPYTFYESSEEPVEEINWDYRSLAENEVAVVYIYFKNGNVLQIECAPGADKCKMQFPQLISGTPRFTFGELTVACIPK